MKLILQDIKCTLLPKKEACKVPASCIKLFVWLISTLLMPTCLRDESWEMQLMSIDNDGGIFCGTGNIDIKHLQVCKVSKKEVMWLPFKIVSNELWWWIFEAT